MTIILGTFVHISPPSVENGEYIVHRDILNALLLIRANATTSLKSTSSEKLSALPRDSDTPISRLSFERNHRSSPTARQG